MAKRPRKPRIDVKATPAAAELWLGQPLGSPSTLVPGVSVAGTAPIPVTLSGRGSAMTAGKGDLTESPDTTDQDIASATLTATKSAHGVVLIGDVLTAEIVKAPPKRVVRPKTKLGRAVLANGPVIAIHVQSMVSIVDLEITRLQQTKPRFNDLDSNAEFDAKVTFLRTLKKALANLQKAALDFPSAKVAEGTLAKVLKELGAPFQEFWKKDGAKYISNTATIGLITGRIPSLAHWVCQFRSLLSLPVLYARTSQFLQF